MVKLGLEVNKDKCLVLKGYGNGRVNTIGSTQFVLRLDGIERNTYAQVVPDHVQDVSLLVGQPFTELADIVVHKDSRTVTFFLPAEVPTVKVKLKHVQNVIVPPNHCANIKIISQEPACGDFLVESSFRSEPKNEYIIPRTIIRLTNGHDAYLPVINVSQSEVCISSKRLLARGVSTIPERLLNVNKIGKCDKELAPFTLNELEIGPVSPDVTVEVLELINRYRHCFAKDMTELGEATSMKMDIKLNPEQPFTYRPYRMSETEKNCARQIISELLESGIIRNSNSAYSSPILLVKKKDGDYRMCVDYRKLNKMTIKDRFPLPRIDDQIDKLHGSKYFIYQ